MTHWSMYMLFKWVEIGPSSGTSHMFNELSRSKSCSHKRGSVVVEPRRKSCDVRARSSLSSLFDMDDGGDDKGGNFMDESVSGNVNEGDSGGDGCEIEHEEWRTMKKHIDLECRSKKVKKGKDLKEHCREHLGHSSFSEKLQKWRQKRKMRMQQQSVNVGSLNRVGISVESMNVRH